MVELLRRFIQRQAQRDSGHSFYEWPLSRTHPELLGL